MNIHAYNEDIHLIDQLIIKAMQVTGRLLSQDIDEARRFDEIEVKHIQIPERLSDNDNILNNIFSKGNTCTFARENHRGNKSYAHEMALMARNAKTDNLPSEIREKMQADKNKTREKQNGDSKT